MAAIPNFGASNTSATSTSDTTTWSTVVSYTLNDTDQIASATYVVFWNSAATGASATSDYQIQVTQDGTAKASVNVEPKEVATPVDRDQQGGFFFFTAAGTPAPATFQIQVKSEAAVNSTAHNGYLRIVKLPANSVWVESTADQAFSGGSIADKSGASISVTNGQEYLFLASAEVDANTTGAIIYIQAGGTNYPLVGATSDNSNYTGAMLAVKATANSDPVKFRAADNSGANVRNVRLLALKVSDFNAIHFVRMSSDGSAVGTTYTTQLTNTQTVVASDHLVIAAFALNPGSATVSGYGRLTSGGSQVEEAIREGASGFYESIIRTETYTAGSKTWTLDAKSESGSLAKLANGSSIAVIDLQEPLGGTTGWKSPGSTANRTYGGSYAWSPTANIASSDGANASATLIIGSGSTNYLEASNFGFTTADLPSGSTILGIEVEVERRTSGSTATDNFAKLINGTAGTAGDEVGSNKATGTSLPGSDTNIAFGGAADTWSAGLSSLNLRSSSFGFRYQVAGSPVSESEGVFVDHIRVRATWAAHTGGYSADAAITEAGDTVAGTSGLKIAGVSAMTEAADTVAAAGQAGTNIRSGELAATEAGDTIAATGALGPMLNALSLSNSSIVENSTDGTFIGNIIGKTAGSTLSLTYTAGGRVKLGGSGESRTLTVGGASNYDVTPTHDVTILETLSGYPDRSTTLTITITNNAGYSPSPWLYDSSVSESDFNFIHSSDPDAFASVSYVGRSYQEVSGIGTGIAFSSGGTYEVKQRESNPSFVEGDTITGATSGATATVNTLDPKGGSWALGTQYGNFGLYNITGTFLIGEQLNVGANSNVANVAISFTSGGTYQVQVGDTVTGATSGKTAVVAAVYLKSGTWAAGTAAGSLYISSTSGTFVNGENLNVGANSNVATTTLIIGDLNAKQSVYEFEASFTDTSHTIDFHMDERYGSQAAAQVAVDKYTPRLGKLPKIIRENFLTVKGLMGDGTFNAESVGHYFTIYEDRADERIANDDLEESFFHEAIHAALQSAEGDIGLNLLSLDWGNAVTADGKYITKYAFSSNQEDFAESALFAYTLHEHPERFPEPDRTQIAEFTPARHAFWNSVFFPNQLDVTEDDDTLVATGGTVGSYFTVTEASDSLAATGVVALKGSAGLADAGDTVLAATGGVRIKGVAAEITEASDTLSATGAFGAYTAITEADDVLASTGVVALRAQASIIEGADLAAGAGSLFKIAALAVTEDSDSLVSTALARILAVLSRTEANDSIVATGEGVLAQSGTLIVTEANDTVASTGAVRIGAAAGLVEANDNLTSTGYAEGEYNNLIIDNLSVPENANVGDVVGEVFNRRPGSTLSLTNTGNDTFELDDTFIVVAGPLDWEDQDSYEITVTESGVPGYPDKDNIFTITVTDVAEVPSGFLSLVEASDTLIATATMSGPSGVWTVIPRPESSWSVAA